MYRPENEKDYEEVMQIPKSLKVCTPWFLEGGSEDDHKTYEHNVSRPSRTTCNISKKEALEAEIVFLCQFGEVGPMSDGMNPCEEDEGVSYQLMEGDILICIFVRTAELQADSKTRTELDNAIQRRLSSQRYERAAHSCLVQCNSQQKEDCTHGRGEGQHRSATPAQPSVQWDIQGQMCPLLQTNCP